MGSALNIGVTGLRAAQIAMDATAHNVANSSTPFFAKNLIDFNEQRISQTGDGVIASIRTSNSSLPQNLLNNISDQAAAKTKAGLLDKLNSALNSANIPQNMTDFFNSWADLSADPTSSTAREVVLQKTNTIAQSVSGFEKSTNDIVQQINYDNKIDTQQFNSLLQELSQINNLPTSDVNGQKQNILNKLNEIASVTSPDNGRNVYLRTANGQGKQILAGSTFSPLSASDLQLSAAGSIGGRFEVMNQIIPQTKTELSTDLEPIFNDINNQHKLGFDQNNQLGKNLFNWTSGNVFSITSNNLSRAELAASDSNIVPTNGQNANTMFTIGNTGSITTAESIGAMKAKLQGLTNQANNLVGILGGSVDSALAQWNNQFGVNLDEEAVNAIKFQRMYEANAKVIKTADEMLGTLLSIKA